MPITSPHNPKLKEIRRLGARPAAGRRAGRFVAEGEDLLAAAQAAGWPAVECLVASGSGLPGTEVEPDVLAAVSSLGSGTRAIGVYERRWASAQGPLCVALHGVGDPGNVGTIIRSAQAFGAGSVVLGAGSADPFGTRAVRASMGAVFHVPVAQWAEEDLPRPLIALDARAEQDLRGPIEQGTLMVGAERDGLPEEVVRRADDVRRIPIGSESLNAAMAATVALYEARRRP